MPVVHGLRPWGHKPPPGTPIRTGHPLADRLLFLFPFNEAGGSRVYSAPGTIFAGDPVGGLGYAMGGTPEASWRTAITDVRAGATPNRIGIMPTSGNNIGAGVTGALQARVAPSTNSFTMAFCAIPAAASQGGSYHGVWAFGNYDPAIYLKTTTAAWGMYDGGNQGFSTDLQTGVMYTCVASIDGGTGTGYVNGIPDAATNTIGVPTGGLRIGSSGGAGGNATEGIVFWIGCWDKPLTQMEAAWLTERPFDLFMPRRFLALGEVTGATEVDATLGAVAIAALDPTVAAAVGVSQSAVGAVAVAAQTPAAVQADTAIDAGLGAVVVAATTPAAVEAETLVESGLGAVAIAGLNPTVTAAVDVSAGLGDVAIAALDSTVKIDAGIDAGVGAVVIGGLDASVGAGQDVAATLGAVAVAGLNPTVEALVDVNVDAGVGAVVVAGLDPTLKTDVEISQAAVGAVAVAGLGPEVSTGQDVPATLGAVVVGGQNPTVTVPTSVAQSAPGAIAVAGLDPSLKTDVNVAQASEGAIAVGGYAPVVLVATDIVTTLGALAVAGLNPSIATETNVEPGTGAVVATGANPSVDVTTDVQVTAGAVVIAGSNPSVSTGGGTQIGGALGELLVQGLNVVVRGGPRELEHAIDVEIESATVALDSVSLTTTRDLSSLTTRRTIEGK